MTKKELSEIHWLYKEIAMWQKELDRLENQSLVKGQNLSDAPHGSSTRSKVENQAVQPETIKADIEVLKERAEQEKNKIRQYIKSINDSQIRQIINYRFVEHLKWDEVAARMGAGYTADSVRMALRRFFDKKTPAHTGQGYRQE